MTLHIDEARKPSEELSDILDYSAPDDQLLGHMHAYMKQRPEHRVRLLTHDAGPMGTARSLDLPFTPIPDRWLRKPEETEAEKENRNLRDELRRLRAGPQFAVTFFGEDGTATTGFEGRQRVHAPLSASELEQLMAALRKRLPSTPTFNPLSFSVYREWLDECEEILVNLHREVEVQAKGIPFLVGVENSGTSPGRDSLITFSARGDFRVLPFRNEERTQSELSEWKRKLPLMPSRESALRSTFGGLPNISLPYSPPPQPSRDPHRFYYTAGFPEYPEREYALECSQWRHQTGEEYFDGEIFANHGAEEVRGLLQCTVHAGNLPDPVEGTVPVAIAVEQVSVWDSACALVEAVDRTK